MSSDTLAHAHNTASDRPVLYVSPCGRSFLADPWEAQFLATDISQVDLDGVGRAYRRLDADWFAWLAYQLARGLRMARTGDLTPDQQAGVREVQERLRVVRTWALQHIGKEALADAINRGIPTGYQAPVCRLTLWGKNGAPGGTQTTKGKKQPMSQPSEIVAHKGSEPPWRPG